MSLADREGPCAPFPCHWLTETGGALLLAVLCTVSQLAEAEDRCGRYSIPAAIVCLVCGTLQGQGASKVGALGLFSCVNSWGVNHEHVAPEGYCHYYVVVLVACVVTSGSVTVRRPGCLLVATIARLTSILDLNRQGFSTQLQRALGNARLSGVPSSSDHSPPSPLPSTHQHTEPFIVSRGPEHFSSRWFI